MGQVLALDLRDPPFSPQFLPNAVAYPASGHTLCCNRRIIPDMSIRPKTLRRRLKALHRNLRGASMAVRAFASTDHPLLAHVIPIRRCNLACTYCNEFDDVSSPVPTNDMFARVDKLAALGTADIIITLAPPRLHPQLSP